MYAAIDCRTVELLTLTPRLSAWLDEEGMYTADPNIPATLYLADHHGLTHQVYYGHVLLTGGADDDGDTLSIDPRDAAEIRRMITR